MNSLHTSTKYSMVSVVVEGKQSVSPSAPPLSVVVVGDLCTRVPDFVRTLRHENYFPTATNTSHVGCVRGDRISVNYRIDSEGLKVDNLVE